MYPASTAEHQKFLEYRQPGNSGLKVLVLAELGAASDITPIYPYWHQRQFTERNPLPTTA
jgi:hypothetical protein